MAGGFGDPIDAIDRGTLYLTATQPELAPLWAFIDAIAHLFDWLFGGGHAGSCGAFRDLYFKQKDAFDGFLKDTVPKLQWLLQQQPDVALPAVQDLNLVVAGYRKFIDAGWDKFKGSNLLGQTMFGARLNNYIDMRWTPIILNWNNAYTYHQTQKVWEKLNKIDVGPEPPSCCSDGTITALAARVEALEKYVNGEVQPNIQRLWQRIQELQGEIDRLPLQTIAQRQQELQDQITALQSGQTELKDLLLNDVFPRLETVQDAISYLINQFRQETLDRLQSALDRIEALTKEFDAFKKMVGSLMRVEMLFALNPLTNAVQQLQVDIENIGAQTPGFITTWTQLTNGLIADFKQDVGVIDENLQKMTDALRKEWRADIAALRDQLGAQLQTLSDTVQEQAKTIGALDNKFSQQVGELLDRLNTDEEELPGLLTDAIDSACLCAFSKLPEWLEQLGYSKTPPEEPKSDLTLSQMVSLLGTIKTETV